MSATAQNFGYVFGKKKENAKENVISRERLEKAKQNAARFMPEIKTNGSEARDVK